MPARLSRPLLLGHRGARISDSRIPENTFAAFDLALQEGCDGFEFDVRCTRDGRLLICHDPEFMGRRVANADYCDFQPSGLCLEDVLTRYASTAFLDIELKVPEMHHAVIAALQHNPPQRGYFVSSFHPEAIVEIEASNAAVPLGFICDKKKELDRWRSLPVQFVVPQQKLVTRELIEEIHAKGKQVFVWTVNDKRDMLRLAEWGVDALISDNPDVVRETFR